MRRMKDVKTGTIINVVEFVMLKHSCWEYYITDQRDDSDGSIEILAYGDEVELAIIYLSDIKSQILYRSKDLKQFMPVPGWKWIK